MNNNLIQSCNDCEFRNICRNAFSAISPNCGMRGQEKCERAFYAVERAKALMSEIILKTNQNNTGNSNNIAQKPDGLWLNLRTYPANITPETGRRLLLLSQKPDGKKHAQFGSYHPNHGYILDENPAPAEDIFYITIYPDYWCYMD